MRVRIMIGLLVVLGACGPGDDGRVTVFAASSTTDALTDLAQAYGRETGHVPRLSFAASSVLARQIEHGAPADVFVSANPQWADHLVARGLVAPDRVVPLLSNRLVLVARKGASLEATLTGDAPDGRLALGDPSHVPAGMYARQALESLGWWADLQGRLLPADNVRAALRLVQLGEADWGVVYAGDVPADGSVRVVATFPLESHAPIVYPLVRVTDRAEAAAFCAYLQTEAARAVFVAHGFEVVADAATKK